MHCYGCNSTSPKRFLSLGHQPPSDAFLSKKQLREPEETYPLDVYYCPDCTLVQLGHAVDPAILFREYVYTSGSNSNLRVSLASLAEKLVTRSNLAAKDLVIDIGSNDGTLLSAFREYGVRILGVDPSSVGKAANKAGIPTVHDFFTAEVAKEIVRSHGKTRLIVSTNAFAHVHELQSYLKGVRTLLTPDGIFVTESQYLLDVVENLQFDQIYHEHLRYYTITSLNELLSRHDMEVIDAERISSHGGSIRVYAARRGRHPVDTKVLQLIKVEKKAGLTSFKTFERFARSVEMRKMELVECVVDLRKHGARVMGIGAPAKGNTLLNYCHLDDTLVECLVEKSPLKIGFFAPGSHIPVVHEDVFFGKQQPDYGLLLSWNLADVLIPKLRTAGFRGKFILPNPKVTIVQ